MTLDEALKVLAAPDTDVADIYKPLRVVGTHLATLAGDVTTATTALAVDVAGIALADGAADLFGGRRTRVVAARPTTSWANPVDLRWITARPPADRPLGLFVSRIVTGVTVRAVLDDLGRAPDGPPITLFAVTAFAAGVQVVRHAHPVAHVVTPEERRP